MYLSPKEGYPALWSLVCAVGVCFVIATEQDFCLCVGCVLAVNLV